MTRLDALRALLLAALAEPGEPPPDDPHGRAGDEEPRSEGTPLQPRQDAA